MVDVSMLEPNYGDPASTLAVQPSGVQQNPSVTTAQVPVGGYDPVEFQKQIARITQAARTKSFAANGELTKQLDQYGEDGPQYSPEAMAYFNAVNNYINNNGTGYNLSPTHINDYNFRSGGAPLTDEQVRAFAAQPLENQFVANFGYTGNTPSQWESGNLQFAPDQQYRLIDRKTGQLVYSGTGYDAGSQISKLASGLADTSGNKADWIIEKATPGSTDWSRQYSHEPEEDGFGTFLKLALPLALGPLGGLFGAATGMTGLAAGALGAATGSALGGIANGDSIGDILKGAALSGGLSYAGGALGGVGSGGGAAGSTAGSAGSAAGSAAGGIGNLASDALTVVAPSLGGALGAGLGSIAGTAGSLAGAASSSAPNTTPTADADAIVVQAGKLQQAAAAINSGAGIGQLTAMGLTPSQIDVARQLAEQQNAPQNDSPLTVTGQAPTGDMSGIIAPGALVAGGGLTLASGAGGAGSAATAPPADTGDIVVQGAGSTGGVSLPVVGGIGAAGAAAAAAGGAGSTAATAAPKTTLQKITDALTAAGLGTELIGSLLGGGGGGSLGNFTGSLGNGNLNSVFHQTLPTSGTRIGGGSNLAARVMPQQDWTKYGMRPEQSFFNNVPQTYTPPLPGQTDQWTHLARGGPASGPRREGFAVNGPGSGRSDHVPAMLSDGEYVMDAETVGLLGDGSNKAGAAKLDQFRVNLRKHKGKQLAKGKFSLSAKAPEAYMAGVK